jgi:hypothetical protein
MRALCSYAYVRGDWRPIADPLDEAAHHYNTVTALEAVGWHRTPSAVWHGGGFALALFEPVSVCPGETPTPDAVPYAFLLVFMTRHGEQHIWIPDLASRLMALDDLCRHMGRLDGLSGESDDDNTDAGQLPHPVEVEAGDDFVGGIAA